MNLANQYYISFLIHYIGVYMYIMTHIGHYS